MRNTLAIFFFLFLSCQIFAAGGVWVLEIKFQSHNDDIHRGYLSADYWANDFEHLIGKDSLFQIEFQKWFGNSDSIVIYDEIHDQQRFSQIASFPMHSFQLVPESIRTIPMADVNDVSLLKVWKRTDYMINVLSDIHDSDTLWISGSTSVEYPIGEDVGCRLEVHAFDENSDHQALLKEFVSIYVHETAPLGKISDRGLLVLKGLKAQKVVVVELCGC